MCLAVALIGQDNALCVALALRFPSGARVGLPFDLDTAHGGKVPQLVEPQAQVIGYGKTGARPIERGAGPSSSDCPRRSPTISAKARAFPRAPTLEEAALRSSACMLINQITRDLRGQLIARPSPHKGLRIGGAPGLETSDGSF